MGPGILGPRSSQVGQSLLSEFARMVLTIVGPERLATIKMVDDQQNVDPVMFSAHRLRTSLYWIRSAVLPSLASPL